MASAYSIRGKRTDYKLSLNPNGSYERRMTQEPDFERIEQGTWFYDKESRVLRLNSDKVHHSHADPFAAEDRESSWWILDISDFEGANTVLVLRWAGLASRNLPILFYHVHLDRIA